MKTLLTMVASLGILTGGVIAHEHEHWHGGFHEDEGWHHHWGGGWYGNGGHGGVWFGRQQPCWHGGFYDDYGYWHRGYWGPCL